MKQQQHQPTIYADAAGKTVKQIRSAPGIDELVIGILFTDDTELALLVSTHAKIDAQFAIVRDGNESRVRRARTKAEIIR